MWAVTEQKSAAAIVGAQESGCPRAKQRETRSRREDLDQIDQARAGQMRTAANTHRALKQDEVTVIDELLEDVLASDNLARAWKRVKANKGAPGIDGMTIEDFPGHARAHWPAVRCESKSVKGATSRRRCEGWTSPSKAAANGCLESPRSWTG